ncbi:MAG: TIGR02452 family protein [Acidobacteria bacterium]|nr:TIGR02452 family protein [Acidobacteriota bacterium]
MKGKSLNRPELRTIAAETISISKSGKYLTTDGNIPIDISDAVAACVKNTRVVSSTELGRVSGGSGGGTGRISIISSTTLDAARALMKETGRTPAILNFASAIHPGGGFRNGTMSQEEDIAYRSALYAALSSRQDYYEESLSDLFDGLYFDKAVYTSGLVVIRDGNYGLSEPWLCDCVTAPAPNRGAALEHGVPEEKIAAAMERRIDLALRTFILNGNRNIVLGAFGCGVFRNLPEPVAERFRKALFDDALIAHFDRILFAIPNENSENHRAFRKIFPSY